MAIPLVAQKGMLRGAKARAPEAFDLVETRDAGYSPFLSMPETVATFLVKSAGIIESRTSWVYRDI